ncbi:uncharacterized protein BDZ83DRAFT_655176 [Colletotrichum acutatum]|uniref:Uncharacterized protein n=1 Tax=Glomerella acutata TaxID=27357 RepID=A0AAD8XES9_GLOAC|nr:uncharacterized protein BDZ83DRAFT_655176 [Colletotrichum acutatum]KAK1718015.1 hypothetical protein BDZ83DRAFT_655176 [Colletotrichum acutatum]
MVTYSYTLPGSMVRFNPDCQSEALEFHYLDSPFYLSVSTRNTRHALFHCQQRLKHLTDSSIQEASSPTPSPPGSIHHRTPRDWGVLPPADLASRLTPLPERSHQNAPPATTQLPAGLSGPTPRHTDGQVLSPLLQLNQAYWSTLSRQMHTQEVTASHGNTSDNSHYDLSEGWENT